jgi:pimeloyl-ACP methyl ester carboxylesterase
VIATAATPGDTPPAGELGEGLGGRIRHAHGPAVLWLHGYTMDSRVWDEMWAALPGWEHIGVDLPGHGASPMLEADDLPALGRRVSRLALARGARHLVALSAGTLLGLQAAIDHPRAFSSLTLAAPALAGGPEDPAARLRYLQLSYLYREFGRGPHLTDLWLRSPPHIFTGLRAFPDRFDRIRAVIEEHPWSELGDARIERLADAAHDASRLARITASVLVLRGEAELPAFVRSAAVIRDAVPDTREVVLPGLGHLCLLEDPAAAVEHLRRQLERS